MLQLVASVSNWASELVKMSRDQKCICISIYLAQHVRTRQQPIHCPHHSSAPACLIIQQTHCPAQVPTYAAQRQVLNHKSEGLLFEVQLVRIRR